ncbi:MAG: serine/threonine-protein kinase [Pyrinomonadaceae bacterium]
MIGQIVGNYKIEEKLGEGGMGAVYKGVDTMLDREVAIKALRPELASQTSVVERFRKEAVTLAKLNHPNIATLYTMFRQGEELYMVLEFVRGETLDNIMKRRGALPADEAIPVFCQVLDGIDHAHDLGIVHRDIKPANMMLTEKGTLKVLDFGIARLLGSARMTRAGNIIGTLEYMAPEQVRGLETDGRSDIYALGMMLYEVLTGKLPFDTDNEFELMKAQIETVPLSPRSINPSIPVEVELAIMKAIEKDPEARFQTGGEFRSVLMDAGFAGSGTLQGVTGTFKGVSSRPSNPTPSLSSVGSDPGLMPILPPSLDGLKETRLGASATAPAGMKATRLGAVGENVQPAAASFFSKLTAIHYAGAGAVLLLLVGVIFAVPILYLFLGSSGSKTDNSKAANTIESRKPDVVTIQQPQQQPLDPPSGSSSVNPPSGGGTGELVPIESTPQGERQTPRADRQPPSRTERPSSVARQQPPSRSQPPAQQQQPPQRQPPPQPQPTPKKETKTDKAAKILKSIFGHR